ncbi:MAG: helix-turn-helix domain-containing protein [Clostridia bacterium]|nr:helix-turn-helix domain-containing protein [Clostridia bacterium]
MKNSLYINRTRLGLTQQMLAERAGISRRTVCMLEQEAHLPSYRVAMRVCRVLGLRPEEVFGQ